MHKSSAFSVLDKRDPGIRVPKKVQGEIGLLTIRASRVRGVERETQSWEQHVKGQSRWRLPKRELAKKMEAV